MRYSEVSTEFANCTFCGVKLPAEGTVERDGRVFHDADCAALAERVARLRAAAGDPGDAGA